MNTFANAIKDVTSEKAFTENGAEVYATSGTAVLDMFFGIGAVRTAQPKQIIEMVEPAFKENPELALRVLFWARDIRGGAGERRVFKVVLEWLSRQDEYRKFAEIAMIMARTYGRWDDIFVLFNTPLEHEALQLISSFLANGDKLLAKWIPRKGPINAKIRKHLKVNEKTLRKVLVELTNVVETDMCNKNWENIKFSSVPSVAMARYTKAFYKHQEIRFGSYIESLKTGKVNVETGKVETINTGAIFPYDVTKPGLNKDAAQAIWQNLPNYIPDGASFIPMVDTSGSMGAHRLTPSLTAMDVAVSLGIYMAERNTSAFKDLWMNFSSSPKFRELKGDNIQDKIRNLNYQDWGMSTNLEAAFGLILDTALENKVPQDEMPKSLVVLSDMEFNAFNGGGLVDKNIDAMFENAGYKRPDIIWWNIAQRGSVKTPVRAHAKGFSLVSGFSPTVAEQVMGGSTTPYEMMMKVIMNKRYDFTGLQ